MNYFVFDVESIGLDGEGFAVGYVLVDEEGNELENGYAACSPDVAVGTVKDRDWIEQHVVPNLPEYTLFIPKEVRTYFWDTVIRIKKQYQDVTFWADCGSPVESNFIYKGIEDDPLRAYIVPYPLHEIGTVLLLNGLDPTATYYRLHSELPKHNPLNDARQSARLLVESLPLPKAKEESGFCVEDLFFELLTQLDRMEDNYRTLWDFDDTGMYKNYDVMALQVGKLERDYFKKYTDLYSDHRNSKQEKEETTELS
jgi:hypothetical protein